MLKLEEIVEDGAKRCSLDDGYASPEETPTMEERAQKKGRSTSAFGILQRSGSYRGEQETKEGSQSSYPTNNEPAPLPIEFSKAIETSTELECRQPTPIFQTGSDSFIFQRERCRDLGDSPPISPEQPRKASNILSTSRAGNCGCSVSLFRIITDKDLSDGLEEFLEKELCVENFHFLKSSIQYAGLFAKDDSEDEVKKEQENLLQINEKGRQMFEKYFKKMRVNIAASTITEIEETIKASQDALPPTLFDRAFREVYELLCMDVFRRFLSSDIFRKRQLEKIVQRMQQEQGGLEFVLRKHAFKSRWTASGDEIVKWITSNCSDIGITSEACALEALNELLRDKRLENFNNKEKRFMDSPNHLYYIRQRRDSVDINKGSLRNSAEFGTLRAIHLRTFRKRKTATT